MAGGSFFFGVSATMASVVIMRPATDAASCRATRTTFAGSTMPALGWSVWPGGARTHWKAPPWHGAHVKRSFRSAKVEGDGAPTSERAA
jgi:hypothetical protein